MIEIFEEYETAALPGQFLSGSVTFECDDPEYESPWVESIALHDVNDLHSDERLVLRRPARHDRSLEARLFRQLEEKLLIQFADDLAERWPIKDPNDEHRLRVRDVL